MGLLFLFTLFISVRAVVVLPSNLTDLSQVHSKGFQLQGSNLTQRVAPLTEALSGATSAHLQSFNQSGTATQVHPGNSISLTDSEIACISCDPDDYPGFYTVDQTVQTVLTASALPAAVLLYTHYSSHCNLTADDQTIARYNNIFTLTGPGAWSALQRTFTEPSPTIAIVSMSLMTNVPTDTGDSGNSGDSPNTAMIILYSITGIITALFLGIIITGAVRAHRHPERYGPRRIAGRVRQSRARGIARAMLETIPVVKFGDNDDEIDAAKRDVEMSTAEDPAREHSPPRDGIPENSTPTESELPTPVDDAHHAPAEKTETPETGNFSCPICTDDFIKGQDLRVLPCNHRFHMECIDPWLMNVSGTCPLCRIDLNPPPEEPTDPTNPTDQPAETGETQEPEPPATQEPQGGRHTHRRLTNYLHGPLNARHMRDATVEERLAALRRVREANQDQPAAEPTPEGTRRRLTTRLRDKFRIRTRAHGESEETATHTPVSEEAEAEAESGPSMPAAPAATHPSS
ncbi:uncharacterized protein N7511_009336 [Penicillium nucicola]|uniref:uncharacterized protein n=1 Tax=Penicillium nucicola TaxID=1850975 RepID=UPI0025455ACC|nr:uncharacterized protein N7511_009336 [Penicillium nucicola]KAJ5747640.1 hypothetical protein N7511_009336 [Penicillium nucicola]